MIQRMFFYALILVPTAIPQTADRLKSPAPVVHGADTSGKLWVDPTDIESRNLLNGAGGEAHRPKGNNFVFVSEDQEGSNPKFVVKDADGVEWKVKLASEAKSEVAASRFVWAAGYFTREYYFLPSIHVDNMPTLHRGGKYVQPGGNVPDARLMRVRKSEKKVGSWTWMESPFLGTREFNALRVMMALINNWDLKDENNAIYEAKDKEDEISVPLHREFMVTDLGATFGTAGIVKGKTTARGNLESYRESPFIASVEPDVVNFSIPGRPQWTLLVVPQQYIRRTHLQWIGKNIPKQHAIWLGQLLSRLSHDQVCDAFRSAGYSPEEVEGFAQIIEGRIRTLAALQ